MKFDPKFGGYDVFIISGYIAIFTIISIVTDEPSVLTVLSLPLIFILPGYLAMLAMYPVTRSITLTERLALTLGLSIMLLPSLGLLLNFTPFGIRQFPILGSMILFAVLTALLIRYRRSSIPAVRQFPPRVELATGSGALKKSSPVAIILYAGITAVLLGIIYMLILFTVTDQPRETFTEFYIVNDSGEMIEKPLEIKNNTSEFFNLVVNNYEGETTDYELIINVFEFDELWEINIPVRTFAIITLDDLRSPMNFNGDIWYSYDFTLDDSRELYERIEISLPDEGNYRLQFILNKKTEQLKLEPDHLIYIIAIVN